MRMNVFTVGATLHVSAADYAEAERIVESLRDWDYSKMRIADWEMVEEWDPVTNEVKTEWEEA